MNPPEMVAELKQRFFFSQGITDDEMHKFDPYAWGFHSYRTVLWICVGYMRLDESFISPENFLKQVESPRSFWILGVPFKVLDKFHSRKWFKTSAWSMGMDIVSFPPNNPMRKPYSY